MTTPLTDHADRMSLQLARASRLIADRTMQLDGLAGQVGHVSLPSPKDPAVGSLGDAVCAAADLPIAFDLGDRPSAADEALGAELIRALEDARARGETDGLGGAVAAWRRVDRAQLRRSQVVAEDGVVLDVVESGSESGPTVVLASACAMSDRLVAEWMRSLSGSIRCLTIETRGTSGPLGDASAFDAMGADVPNQAGDLITVIENRADQPVHLMGLCGGAVNALYAAAARPDLVGDLSLWHGDFELGGESAKTQHQQNLRELLDSASTSRATAAELRAILAESPLAGVPAGLGPIVVRPYVHDELFYRYARLTGATMHWDSRECIRQVHQPTLVVTTLDDTTAHPDGSLAVAERLSHAAIEVQEHGTHLDAFTPSHHRRELLESFLFSNRGDAR